MTHVDSVCVSVTDIMGLDCREPILAGDLSYFTYLSLQGIDPRVKCQSLTEAAATDARPSAIALGALHKLVLVLGAFAAQCTPLAGTSAHVTWKAVGGWSQAVGSAKGLPLKSFGQERIGFYGRVLTW